MDLDSDISKDGEMMLYTGAGTLGTANACLPLPEHRRLIECETYSASFHDEHPSVVEVYLK